MIPNRRANAGHDEFVCWAWVIPMLLLVAAFGLRQIDLYAPTSDEFFSMVNAGWSFNGPFSPAEIADSIEANSPAHMPGYFLLLSAWGNLAEFDAALGRVLTIFFALLSLAITYRLLYDIVSPMAGLYAVIILASNAFYNFYIPHMRMYPLMLFLAGAVLWLYLRVLYQAKSPQRTDYAALLLAVFALAGTHVFSVIFFVSLGVYHLLFVPKNSVWWRVSVAISLALILVFPYVVAVIPAGMERAAENWTRYAASGAHAITVWLTVFSNGQPLLLLISLIAVALGHRKRLIVLKPYYCLLGVYLLTLGLFAQFTPFVSHSGMRHQLPGWLILALVVTLGLHSLYRFRRWLSIILLLWVAAGAAFQTTADWKFFLAGRIHAFDEPPWHVISRALARTNTLGPVFGIRLPLERISDYYYFSYSQLEHSFDRADIDLRVIDDLTVLNETIRYDAIAVPEFWILYQPGVADENQVAQIHTIVNAWRYAACESREFGINTVMEHYRWQTLGCDPDLLSSSNHNELIDYKFHATRVDSASSRVFFVDEWTARSADSLDSYRMSFQLISPDWDNVAQVDLPLVHEGTLRQFSIDIGHVAPGNYRLMAILFNKHSGERLAWNDGGADPQELLPLAEVVID